MNNTEYAACYVTLENLECFVLCDASSSGIRREIDAVCEVQLYDVMPGVIIPNKRGPWVWEGIITHPDMDEVLENYTLEPQFAGFWRRPTMEEWMSWGGFE